MVAVPSAWAASAAPPAKPAGQGDVLQGVVRGEVAEGDAEMGREISHTLPAPQQGLQQARVKSFTRCY